MTNPAHVELRGVSKRFGATAALTDVDLVIARGTVHALVGENGAGKSTLGKMIAGIHGADAGQMLVAGRAVTYRSPRQALEDGLTIVAQELSLLDSRSVVQNVYLGQEERSGPFLRPAATLRRFSELTRTAGIDVAPDTRVSDLSVAQQQKVEILRALARDAELIVMDEPTARLSSDEARQLQALVRRLADAGTTVVLVSHFLEEVLEMADVVTVLRDGRVIRTSAAENETPATLVEAMIGRSLDGSFPSIPLIASDAPTVLEVTDLGREGVFDGISLKVAAGEVVVMTGLVGSGRSEVVRAIFGAEVPDRGSVRLEGREFRPRHPRQALAAGVAMIPESRKTQGLFLTKSVEDNITLPHLAGLSRFGLVDRRREKAASSASATQAGVKCSHVQVRVSDLSGGNQQKVLFAKALFDSPKLLIADEPTRGVDVASKRAIYDLIAALAADGLGVLVVTSEIEEVVGLAHRVLVMRAGALAAELVGTEITEQHVINAAFGRTTGGES